MCLGTEGTEWSGPSELQTLLTPCQVHPVRLPDPLSPSGSISHLCEESPEVSGVRFLFTGVSGVQGCDCGLHPGGVAAAEACAEGPVQGRDDGELLEPGLAG